MHFNKNNLNLAQKSLFRKEQNQQFMSGFCASIYRLSPVFRKIPSYMRTKAIEEYLLFSDRYHLGCALQSWKNIFCFQKDTILCEDKRHGRQSPVFRKIPSCVRTKDMEDYLLFSERYHLV